MSFADRRGAVPLGILYGVLAGLAAAGFLYAQRNGLLPFSRSDDGAMEQEMDIAGEGTENGGMMAEKQFPANSPAIQGNQIVEGGAMPKNGGAGSEPAGGTMMDGESGMAGKSPGSYTGTLIAGSLSGSPLLEFNQKDYDAAAASGKLVVLYFYANWCPNCKAEFPKMEAVFDDLNDPNVVGFRVNYNDSETAAEEKESARAHGVAYQHTKVFVRNGERILKSPESWDESRYRSEIAKSVQ